MRWKRRGLCQKYISWERRRSQATGRRVNIRKVFKFTHIISAELSTCPLTRSSIYHGLRRLYQPRQWSHPFPAISHESRKPEWPNFKVSLLDGTPLESG